VVHAVNEIVQVQGLHSASAGSLVRFTRSGSAAPALGLVMAVQTERVIVALLNEGYQHSIVTVGDRVSHTRGDVPKFPVGPAVLGRMLSPLGQPCDQQPQLSSSLTHLPTLSPSSPSLTNRASPTHFLSTGIKHLDFFHPLTRGLRIGLLGDKSTGKTTLALDALIFLIQQSRLQPSSSEHVYGVYVLAGKKTNEMNRVRERLMRAGVLDNCVVVCSSDSDSMGSQYLAPFSGCTVADQLRDEGKHVVIVYDDLVTHGAICTAIDRSAHAHSHRTHAAWCCTAKLNHSHVEAAISADVHVVQVFGLSCAEHFIPPRKTARTHGIDQRRRVRQLNDTIIPATTLGRLAADRCVGCVLVLSDRPPLSASSSRCGPTVLPR